jgi:hypothetical protein
MYPIFINEAGKGLDYDEFKDNLISICNTHLLENRASAFAFIIYDFSNEHVRKILGDKEYWESLHMISGKYLTVFSLFEGPTKQIIERKKSMWRTTMSYDAVSVRTDQSIDVSYKEIIASFFGNETFNAPSILFFQVEKDKISKSFFVELKEEKIEEGFLEIKKLIQQAIEAVKGISKENIGNYKEIFDLIESNVKASVRWKSINKISKKIFSIKDFISLFTG